MFIPDPGSRIRTVSIPDPGSSSKNLSKLTQKSKKWFLCSKKYDPGCSSRIPDPDADFLPSRIPGSKKHPILDPGSGSATLQKRYDNNFFPTSFVIVVGSGIQEPRSKMDKNQRPGINITDPQHWQTACEAEGKLTYLGNKES
jgi:hypothetical protein